MSKLLTLILVITPHLLFSQSTSELKWSMRTKVPPYSCFPIFPVSYDFFDDSTFEYKCNGRGIYGSGTYEVADSIITCYYNGERTLLKRKEGWVEIKDSSSYESLKIKVVYEDDSYELIGANIRLLDEKGQIITGNTSDFDGQWIVENQDFQKIRVSYVGCETLTTTLPNIKGEIVFHLVEGQIKGKIIAKGVVTKHQILSINGKALSMHRVSSNTMIYTEESN